MKIGVTAVEENPSDGDVHFLDDRINECNFETTGIRDGRVLSFFLRDGSPANARSGLALAGRRLRAMGRQIQLACDRNQSVMNCSESA